jgi:hypothetical protein
LNEEVDKSHCINKRMFSFGPDGKSKIARPSGVKDLMNDNRTGVRKHPGHRSSAKTLGLRINIKAHRVAPAGWRKPD